MGKPISLRSDIIEYLQKIPSIELESFRQAFLTRANLDKNLSKLIVYSGNSVQFCELLLSTLISYGQLTDGRDSVIAVLEASKSLVSLGSQNICDQLIASWKTHSIQGFPLVREISASRRAYYQKLIEDVATMKLSRIATAHSHPVHLSKVYIDLPTDVYLDLDVINYQIVDWTVRGEQENVHGISFTQNNNEQYDIQSIKSIIDETQHSIDGKGGNISIEERQRPLILSPLWRDGKVSPFVSLTTIDLASTVRKLVLIGDPGSGKSTFAQYMVLYLIKLQVDSDFDGLPATLMGHWAHGPLTPVYVELRRFIDWQKFPKLEESLNVNHLWQYIVEEILGPNIKFKDELWDDIINGRVLFLIDGLDEAPVPPDIEKAQEQRQRQLTELGQSLSTRFPQNRIIFTSRPSVYENLRINFEYAEYRTAKLIPLNTKQMIDLSSKLFMMSGVDDSSAKLKSEALIKKLSSVADYLKSRPLFLTLMVILSPDSIENELPANEGVLLQKCILLLIDRWTQGKLSSDSQKKLRPEDTVKIFQILEGIAHRAHSRAAADKYLTNDIDVGEIYRGFSLYRNRMYEIVDYLTQQAGIFEPVGLIGSQVYRFAHRTFQEFLAASYLVRNEEFSEVRTLIQSNPLIWREPCFLVGEILSETSPRNLWGLLDSLLDFEVPLIGEKEALWYSVWLAACLVINQKLFKKNIPLDLVQKLKDRIKILLRRPCVLSAVDRVQCGRALGLLGDDRFGTGIREGIPEFDWCTIPAGPFQLGTTPEQAIEISNKFGGDFPIDHETPSSIYNLPEYKISKYLVTHAQFQAFVDAKDGYFNSEWWPPDGLFILNKFGPSQWDNDSPFNLPQNFVSWYEAVAFSKWLSEKLNENIRLPNEVEWEKAARGNDGRIFPWGDEFNPELCNVHLTGLNRPSPVGCFALFDYPWNEKDCPLDMCGNVWEWCISILEIEGDSSTTYCYPYDPKDGREDITLGDEYLRVVRGGSFTNIPFLARTALRGRDRPSLRVARQGIRLVKVT